MNEQISALTLKGEKMAPAAIGKSMTVRLDAKNSMVGVITSAKVARVERRGLQTLKVIWKVEMECGKNRVPPPSM